MVEIEGVNFPIVNPVSEVDPQEQYIFGSIFKIPLREVKYRFCDNSFLYVNERYSFFASYMFSSLGD